MLEYIGAALILLSSLIPPIELRRRGRQILAEYTYFERLFSGICERLSNMRTVGDFVRESNAEELSHMDFSPSELLSSPRSAISRFSFSEELRGELCGYFSTLGRGERSSELSRSESLLLRISEERRGAVLKSGTDIRVRGAVSLAVGLTLVIILL